MLDWGRSGLDENEPEAPEATARPNFAQVAAKPRQICKCVGRDPPFRDSAQSGNAGS
jgi:hypothetical protein